MALVITVLSLLGGCGETAPATPSYVQVTDAAGRPVVGAKVLSAGAPEEDWVVTDDRGWATAPPPSDVANEAILVAAKRGYWSAGAPRPAPGTDLEIVLRSLPDPAQTTYTFGLAGSAADMADTDRCMHCHTTLGAQWNASAHRRATTNPLTLALYDDALAAGAPAAEACGDCHAPALIAPAGRPEGGFDLHEGDPEMRAEGVTCDVCHKIADVAPDPARPGLQGAVSLLLPSTPSPSVMMEHEPIQFGPHGDILNPLMGGSLQPQFRESVFCAGCHSLYQAGGDPGRWPEGLPILTTWEEWRVGPMSQGPTCQGCHMDTLHEDSGAGDIASRGWRGDVSLGFVRPTGEVRRHDWPSVAELGPGRVGLRVDLGEEEDLLVATITVTNAGAGHALPTGEPLRQLGLRVEGGAVGGHAIPEAGGRLARVTLEAEGPLAGRRLDLAQVSTDATHVRFVRPTGRWDDYPGPGVGWFSEPTRRAEDKGLQLFEALGQVPIERVDPAGLTLADDPPALRPGDVAYVVAPNQWAGAPGWMWSKTLVDAQGQGPVHHGRAADIAHDNRLPPGGVAETVHRFPKPAAGERLEVVARLIYRRRADAVARAAGADHEDLELKRASAAWPP